MKKFKDDIKLAGEMARDQKSVSDGKITKEDYRRRWNPTKAELKRGQEMIKLYGCVNGKLFRVV